MMVNVIRLSVIMCLLRMSLTNAHVPYIEGKDYPEGI